MHLPSFVHLTIILPVAADFDIDLPGLPKPLPRLRVPDLLPALSPPIGLPDLIPEFPGLPRLPDIPGLNVSLPGQCATAKLWASRVPPFLQGNQNIACSCVNCVLSSVLETAWFASL